MEKTATETEFYNWYDRFETTVIKANVRNPYTAKMDTIITGFEFGKKGVPTKIATAQAAYFNDFVPGQDHALLGKELYMYVPRDKYKQGDKMTYRQFVKMMKETARPEIADKYNEKNDPNILLEKFIDQ